MKWDFDNISGETSMSVDYCSLKLRFLSLVTNTADLINERTTPNTPSISHALLAPIAIFTTYLFLGFMLIGATLSREPSNFIKIYALVSCSVMQILLSLTVFNDLITTQPKQTQASHILNGVLPMLTITLLISDLVVVLFSSRDINLPPALPTSSRGQSNLDLNV